MCNEKIINHLRAGFSAFWLKTHEHYYVSEKIYSEIEKFERKDGNKYSVIDWNCISESNNNPIVALQQLTDAEPFTILFLYNWHWFADKPQIIQTIQNNLNFWASEGKAIICVSHTNKIPAELEKQFVLFDISLPKDEEIKKIVLEKFPENKINEKEINKIVNSCKGFTRVEIENVLALSLIKTEGKNYSVETINDHKAMTIHKTGFLEVLEPTVSFKDVIGYENLKEFILETIEHPKAKGVMTIGPPGCGKTSLMKAIVKETGKFGLAINMGQLFSKYQGETDQNINTAIEIITAIGNCIVLIDEFEKQFAGASSDGSLDSGTTRRATGRWLDFLQNRPEGIYIVGTANSFNGIPGEYLRPGRWDTSPFFIDLPTSKTKSKILNYYCNKVGIKENENMPDLDMYSGAEIEALVHIASMRNITLIEASKSILPQAKTMEEKINELRNWSKGRTIPAEMVLKTVKQKIRKIDS